MSKAAQDALRDKIEKCEQTNKLVAMVRCVKVACEHYKRLDRKFVNKFEELYPAYTISMTGSGKGPFTSTHIRVWGNGVGYNESLYLSVSDSSFAAEGWKALEAELRREDCSDYIAQYSYELSILEQLDVIAEQVAALADKARTLAQAHGVESERIKIYAPSFTLEEHYKFLK